MKFAKNVLVGALSLSTVFGVVPPQAQALDKGDVGGILGAIIGGALGHDAGDGDAAATIVGAVIGGAIGAVIGNELDEADRRAVAEARVEALRGGRAVEWSGARYHSRTGATGRITIVREGYFRDDGNRQCREYSSEVRVRGRVERSMSQACVDRYGNWIEVNSTEVIYGARPGTRSGPAVGGMDRRGPRGRPLPPVRPMVRLVPDHEVVQLVGELRAARWDSDRNNVLQTYVDYWVRRGQRMSSYRLDAILGSYSYDSDRVRAARIVSAALDAQLSDIQRALSTFRFASDREEARRILMY